MAQEENWTVVYVMIGLVAVIFMCIAVGSTVMARRNRQTAEEIDVEMQPYRRIWFSWANQQNTAKPAKQAAPTSNPLPAETARIENLLGARGTARRLFGRQSLDRSRHTSPAGLRPAPLQSTVGSRVEDVGQGKCKGKEKAAAITEPSVVSFKTAVNPYRMDIPEPSPLRQENVNPYRPYDLPPIRSALPEASGSQRDGPRRPSNATASSFYSEFVDKTAQHTMSGSGAEQFEQQSLQSVSCGRNLMSKYRR